MIEIRNITKKYDKPVLSDVSYTFEKNKIYVIKGVSGCGKTTLLNIIGGLENDYEGECFYDNKNIGNLNKRQREHLCQSVGYVFQSSFLMANLTVLDNLLYINSDRKIIEQYARQLKVEPLLEKYPEQLSGGERQRISVIRTLILNPSVILADEPTASLDEDNSKEMAKLFNSLRSENRTIIIATHENYFDDLADEIIHLDYGIIRNVEHRENEAVESCQNSTADTERVHGNSFRVLIPLIFRRHREKYRIGALLPMIFVIVTILLCFGLQHNFKSEAIRYCRSKYPIDMIAVEEICYDILISECDNIETFDLYVIETDTYSCYPLLSEEDSVLAYGGLIKYGSFPKNDRDVLVSYVMALSMVEGNNVEDCIGEKIVIEGIEYTIAGVVADFTNDNSANKTLYEGDIYYKTAKQSKLVYIPYQNISQYGKKSQYLCGNYHMVKIPGLYEDDTLYKKVKKIVGVGLSAWEKDITDAEILINKINKVIWAAFIVSALMAAVFIKNDIEVDLFYRRKEFGYLQIFGVKKRTIRAQLILERMAKNTIALFLAILVFNVAAVIVKLTTGINGFVTVGHILAMLLIVLGFSFISVMLPIHKFLKKSVLSLITE